jgi:hypothetical protein
MKNRPKLTIYVTTKETVDIDKVKRKLAGKYRATRITSLEGEGVNSVVFNVSLGRANKVWKYFQKKDGIKKIWLGA